MTVDDAENSSDPATVTVDVQPANTPPVAVDTSAVVPENGSVVVQLEGSDADGDALTFDVQPESAQGGSVSAVSNTECEVEGLVCTAEVTYTAPVGYSGLDSFTFTVDDGQDTSDPATVTVDVQPANTPPVAQPGSFPVVSDGAPAGRVLSATDVDGDELTFEVTRQPDNGSVSGPTPVSCAFNPAFGDAWTCQQTWGYLATPGFEGTDSFEFTACDPSEACDTATVTVTVTAPAAQADLTVLTLTDSPDPVTAGGVVAYQATVKNLGPATATGVRVDFGDPESGSLPDGVTFVSGTVTSSAGGSGTCFQSEAGVAVSCTLGIGTVPASSLITWTVTAYLQTSPAAGSLVDVQAQVQGAGQDPNVGNNQLVQSTVVEPAGDNEATEFVPPSPVTETVATSETVLVNGTEVPVAQPGDTTAAAISVPPGGPGGVVTVAEFDCEPPFCAAAARTTVPTPGTPPIDDRVVQFIPPFAPFYDYRKPVTYQIAYDTSVVGGVKVRSVKPLYAKEDNPSTEFVDESQVLYQAAQCPRTLTSSTEFPCLKSAKVLKGKNRLLKGDLVLTLLGTYNDPKIAGFR